MKTLKLQLSNHQYPIHIGKNLINDASLIIPYLKNNQVTIVSNNIVAPLYLKQLINILTSSGIQTASVILPDGEIYKNWESLNLIFDALIAANAERNSTLIALGGGVIGDITGFAAACYQRGAPFIQIPTTLLAQVDSSVGGKTAINHPQGKNMIGAFYQPQLVLADIDSLATLPNRELSAGLAEVIKYALLGDIAFFSWLEQNMAQILQRDDEAITYLVEHCCAMKAKIVAEDEKEHGIRALLNLGHTFGHAIEAGLGFGVWLHGEAVAAGMVLAAELSRELGYLKQEEVERIVSLIQAANLPIVSPNLGVDNWLKLMSHDKKVLQGKLRFILLKAIGNAEVTEGIANCALANVLKGTYIQNR